MNVGAVPPGSGPLSSDSGALPSSSSPGSLPSDDPATAVPTSSGEDTRPLEGRAGLPPEERAGLPPEGRAALRAGIVGNWIDNIHVFLPLTALTPALAVVAGPAVAASTGALVVIAMMLGRPLGGVVFGRISDRLGRTRTTKVAITGTALCALGIACLPTHEVLGAGTLALILLLRFLGGTFVAGEYSAAIPLAMEWSAPRRRGLMSGLILSMAPWAQASVAFAAAALLAVLGPDAYAAWGWRVLFAAGAACSAGMLAYYRSRVADAPIFHRRGAEHRESAGSSTGARGDGPGTGGDRAAQGAAPRRSTGVRSVLGGRYARRFWQVFILMTGLWLLTNTTVILLTARLGEETGLDAMSVSVAMGLASIVQALAMAVAGHLSSLTGRRVLFLTWGLVAAVAGPFVWWACVTSATLGRAALCAAILQVVTVAAYGPVSAYLSERFPTHVRSTGYGMGYSLSLILPALYPFYLPALESVLGTHGAIMSLVALGGALVAFGALLGPRLGPRETDADLSVVAALGRAGR